MCKKRIRYCLKKKKIKFEHLDFSIKKKKKQFKVS